MGPIFLKRSQLVVIVFFLLSITQISCTQNNKEANHFIDPLAELRRLNAMFIISNNYIFPYAPNGKPEFQFYNSIIRECGNIPFKILGYEEYVASIEDSLRSIYRLGNTDHIVAAGHEFCYGNSCRDNRWPCDVHIWTFVEIFDHGKVKCESLFQKTAGGIPPRGLERNRELLFLEMRTRKAFLSNGWSGHFEINWERSLLSSGKILSIIRPGIKVINTKPSVTFGDTTYVTTGEAFVPLMTPETYPCDYVTNGIQGLMALLEHLQMRPIRTRYPFLYKMVLVEQIATPNP